MPASEVTIVNQALTALGQPTITSLTDNVKAAVLANRLYGTVRDQVLREHKWNCATKRATLSALAEEPTFGFSYAYQLPSDFIRLASPEDLSVPFRVQGRTILSDLDELNIVYVYRLEDVSQMDTLLQQCIAQRLASEMAIALTGDRQRKIDAYAEYERKLAHAQYVDSMESPVDQIEANSWLGARLGITGDPTESARV